MWFYLFASNKKYPDPEFEIKSLAQRDKGGELVYLKLSSRDDAPMKNAHEGEIVYLCTRRDGRWLVHGDAVLVGDPERGGTPGSISSIYGSIEQPTWWRRLQSVTVYQEPKGETDLGLDEGTLPSTGQAHVIHVEAAGNGKPSGPVSNPSESALAKLTQIMDEAWEDGRLTPEKIEEAICQFSRASSWSQGLYRPSTTARFVTGEHSFSWALEQRRQAGKQQGRKPK